MSKIFHKSKIFHMWKKFDMSKNFICRFFLHVEIFHMSKKFDMSKNFICRFFFHVEIFHMSKNIRHVEKFYMSNFFTCRNFYTYRKFSHVELFRSWRKYSTRGPWPRKSRLHPMGPCWPSLGFWGLLNSAVWGFALVYYLSLQAHWTNDIDNVIGVDNIPLELNQVFLASGFRMPVTEFFVRMYARAYQHWLEKGDPKQTKDFVFGCPEVRDAYKKHVKEHGSRALLARHLENVQRLNRQPLPVGRVLLWMILNLKGSSAVPLVSVNFFNTVLVNIIAA